MFKRLVLSSFFMVTSLLADFSLLSKEVLPYVPQINTLVNTRSTVVIGEIGVIQGIVTLIINEIDNKKDLTVKLQALSQEDYKTNKETLFLIQKLNSLKDISVDSRNSTTGTLNIMDNFSTNKFKKDLGNAENMGNYGTFEKNIENEDLSKSE